MAEEWNPEFQSLLDNLATTSRKLNEATNNLNAIIAQFEEQLNTISPGVTAYVPIGQGKSLGYGRFNGAWRLLLNTTTEEAPLLMPLQSASRRDRISAVRAFPLLVSALTDTATDTINRIQSD